MSLFNSIIPFKKGSRPRVPCPLCVMRVIDNLSCHVIVGHFLW